MANMSDPPLKDEFAVTADPKEAGKLPRLVVGYKWIDWFGDFIAKLNKTPKVEAAVRYPAGSAGSIGTTPFPGGSFPAGLYRVMFRFRITRPATVNSALQFFVSYTNDTLAQQGASNNETGNLTTSIQAGSLPIRIDSNTAVSYSAVYATAGATPMQYELDAILESIKLDSV